MIEWTEVPESEWQERARMMGFRIRVEGAGYESAIRMLNRTIAYADRVGDPLDESDALLLRRHIMSVDMPPSKAQALHWKVTTHVRGALKDSLRQGGATTKIGFLAKWPAEWLYEYEDAIAGNCPMLFCGIIQHALAPGKTYWRP